MEGLADMELLLAAIWVEPLVGSNWAFTPGSRNPTCMPYADLCDEFILVMIVD